MTDVDPYKQPETDSTPRSKQKSEPEPVRFSARALLVWLLSAACAVLLFLTIVWLMTHFLGIAD